MWQGARAALGLSDRWGNLVRTPFRKQAAKREKTPPMTHGHQCLTESSSLPCLYLRLLGHCFTVSLLCTTPAPRALERETKELWAGVWRTEPVPSAQRLQVCTAVDPSLKGRTGDERV